MAGTHDTKETTELVIATAVVLREVAENGDGNRVRLLASLIGESGTLLKGLAGADKIPAELGDLQPEEIADLYQEVEDAVGEALSEDLREAIKATATTALAGAEAVARWRTVIANRRGEQ